MIGSNIFKRSEFVDEVKEEISPKKTKKIKKETFRKGRRGGHIVFETGKDEEEMSSEMSEIKLDNIK